LKYWIPGRDVTVDEIIERFSGRSSDILTIPSKPIPTGYKIWAVAQVSTKVMAKSIRSFSGKRGTPKLYLYSASPVM
jgi:hypothetical protein